MYDHTTIMKRKFFLIENITDSILEYHCTAWMLEKKRYVQMRKKARLINNVILKLNVLLQKRSISNDQFTKTCLIEKLHEHHRLFRKFCFNGLYGSSVFLFSNCLTFFSNPYDLFLTLDSLVVGNLGYIPNPLLRGLLENLKSLRFIEG